MNNMLDFQLLFNITLSAAGLMGGWILKAVWDALKDLQAADAEMSRHVSAVEILVAGSYVKRDDLATLSGAIFAKLDRIEDKLDGKVDKS